VVVLAVLSFIVNVPAADAQTGYGETTNVLPGQVINLSGIACPPNGTVSITLNGVEVATGTADANGNWSVDVTIPSDLADGTYAVNATCGGKVVFSATFVLGEELSRTGASHVGLLVGIGLAVIVLGTSLVLGSRRVRRERDPVGTG